MPRERGGVGEGAASQLAPSDATTTVVGGIVAAERRRNMSLDNRMDGMQLTRIGGGKLWTVSVPNIICQYVFICGTSGVV